MQIHICKLSNDTQVQGNRSMSRITYSNLYDNTKLKLSQKTYTLENTFNVCKSSS